MKDYEYEYQHKLRRNAKNRETSRLNRILERFRVSDFYSRENRGLHTYRYPLLFFFISSLIWYGLSEILRWKLGIVIYPQQNGFYALFLVYLLLMMVNYFLFFNQGGYQAITLLGTAIHTAKSLFWLIMNFILQVMFQQLFELPFGLVPVG